MLKKNLLLNPEVSSEPEFRKAQMGSASDGWSLQHLLSPGGWTGARDPAQVSPLSSASISCQEIW